MRDSKNMVIGMLCAVVCIMAVAYAAFSTTLKVTTTTSIDSNWCVKISTVKCETEVAEGGVESITVDGETVKLDATATNLSNTLSTEISMRFIQPGDSATCTVTYGNCGTLNAELSHTVSSIVDGTPNTLTPNGEGAIIYTNADDSIKFTITGANEVKKLTPKTNGTDQYGGTATITVVGEYINVPDGQGDASNKDAKIKIVSSASQSV